MSSVGRSTLAALAVCACLASAANAQVASDFAVALEGASDHDRVEATNLTGKGTTAWERGEYDKALEYFRLAYRLYPSPRLQYNFGLAYGALGDKVQAAQAFAAFLAEADDAPESARAYARLSLEELDEQLGHVTLVSAGFARLTLDGIEVASGQGVRVAPGPHAAVAYAADRRPIIREFQLGPGDERTIELDATLAVAPVERAESPLHVSAAPAEGGGGARRWVIWTGAAVVAVGIFTAVVWSLSRDSDSGACSSTDLGCVGFGQ